MSEQLTAAELLKAAGLTKDELAQLRGTMSICSPLRCTKTAGSSDSPKTPMPNESNSHKWSHVKPMPEDSAPGIDTHITGIEGYHFQDGDKNRNTAKQRHFEETDSENENHHFKDDGDGYEWRFFTQHSPAEMRQKRLEADMHYRERLSLAKHKERQTEYIRSKVNTRS